MLLFLVVLEFELDSLVISYLIIKIDPFQTKKIIFLTSPHEPKKPNKQTVCVLIKGWEIEITMRISRV